uniref:F5/8 type C domain-containing protein n=1 Tax=Panagrolaimus superbus TaxID=310955 RepID=A0A914XW88_9BILA
METGEIGDKQISASSSFDLESVGPQNARIRTEKASGAWCPKSQIKYNSYEFLQISLNSTHIIQSIETQGRYANGTGSEYVNQYYIDYFRSGEQWIRYKNRTNHSLLSGNTDITTAVLQTLDPPIISSKIRIVPHSKERRTVCLRVELHGCKNFENHD